MNFLSYAKEIELAGAELYSGLAQKAGVIEVSSIFQFLAREEKRHYEIFDAWQQNSVLPAVEETNLLRYAKESFQKLTEHFKMLGVSVINRDEAYEKALDFEKNSINLYSEALEKIKKNLDNEKQRNILKLIIEQERSHEKLIVSLMEFQRHPGEWLENAEWYHLDEY